MSVSLNYIKCLSIIYVTLMIDMYKLRYMYILNVKALFM